MCDANDLPLHRTTYPQNVDIDRNAVPAHLRQLASRPDSLNIDEPQTRLLPNSMQQTLRAQARFNERDAQERSQAGTVPLEDVRNLHRRQNSLFRPQSRVGNTRQIPINSAANRILTVEADNLPFSDIMCALEKEERVRSQVDQRIAEAKAAGFEGNPTLERARALRTGTLVPRKFSGPGSKSLLGNNVVGMSGGRSSTASYEVSQNESNAFLRRATGVDFEGDKCQRMARKERGLIAPQPIPDPPSGFIPGGGRFLSDRERLELQWDNPHLSGNFVKPHKPINPHQWTDRPVSYRPPIRYNLADEIPFEEPHNRGVFVQPEPIGQRIASDDQLPYGKMPGDSFGAAQQQQVRAPRDESYLAKFKKDIGPKEPALPFSAEYDDNMPEHSERIASYAIVKPKLEREHLEQTSTDSLQRGIELVDGDALYDPTVATPIGVDVRQGDRDERARAAANMSAERAKQQFEAGRATGDNETLRLGALGIEPAAKQAALKGQQRVSAAEAEHRERSDLHSRLAIGGDPEMFDGSTQASALQRAMQAPQSSDESCRARMREAKAHAGLIGDSAAALDEARFGDTTSALNGAAVGAHFSQAERNRATAREKLSLLRARTAARRANAFDDNLLLADTVEASRALGSSDVRALRSADKERERSHRNFQRIRDALQRVRYTMADGDDPSFDLTVLTDRAVQKSQVDTRALQLADKTRQLEQRMMQNATEHSRVHLDEAKFADSVSTQRLLSTNKHLEQGASGDRIRQQELRTVQAGLDRAQRSNLLQDDDGEQFGSTGDAAAHQMQVRAQDMADSATAQRLQAAEGKTLANARSILERLNAYEDLEPGMAHVAQTQLANVSEQTRKRTAERERSMTANRIDAMYDAELTGDNAMARAGVQQMQAPEDQRRREQTQERETKSMRAAADTMIAQNYGTGLDLQSHSMTTQQDIRQLDTKRQALADRQIMNECNSRLTGLDETHEASAYQESLISGGRGGEAAQRARLKGNERERAMMAADRAHRQVLNATDTHMFEHHTIDSGIGTEPRGGSEAFERRADIREERATAPPRLNYDAIEEYLQTEHVLQQLEPVRCDRPSAVLKHQRQTVHDGEIARKERGVPTHLLPAYMLPGGKKQVTPRGSPASSPCPSPIPY